MDQPPDPSSEAAWAVLAGRWEEPAAHRALLDACRDLDALAAVGRRYRAVLEARPADAMAQQMKAEILKRAALVGLAQLPRTRPPVPRGGPWPRRLLLGGTLVATAVLSWLLGRLVLGSG